MTHPQPEPHENRDVAESFGADAPRYDRARPDYPPEIIASVLEQAPGRRVLDVGCGTGIAARQFQAAGCTVLGVEPDERMARLARDAGTEVEVAKFEDWDPRGRVFDAVVAAQAWHWIEPLSGAVTAAEVLRPGSRLTVFWNVFQPPPEVAAALADAYRRFAPAVPIDWTKPPSAAYQHMMDTAATGMTQADAFHAPEESRFGWTRDYTRAEWMDLLPTQGGINRLPEETRAAMLAQLGRSIGDFTAGYTTVSVSARKR